MTELTLIQEDPPKVTRAGGSGREPERWEDRLSQLKEPDMADQWFRVWTYDKKGSAVSRMTSVRARLFNAVPSENWQLLVRPVENTDQFGVYVSYQGTYTPEQIIANAQKHKERSDRVRAAQAASNGGGLQEEQLPLEEVADA